MRTEHLRYFVEVSKCRSISIAAEKLFLTQPAISSAMKTLEKEFEVMLFKRSKNEVTLTEIGTKFLAQAEKILEDEAELYTLINKYQTKENHSNDTILYGSLSISVALLLSYSFFQDAIYDFCDKNPLINLTLNHDAATHIPNNILLNNSDIGLSILEKNALYTLQNDTTIHLRELYNEKAYVIAHKKFGFRNKKSINLQSICEFPIAQTSLFPVAQYFSKELEGKVNLILQSSSLELVKKFVIKAKAITVLTSMALDIFHDSPDVDIIPASDLENGVVCLFYKKDSSNLALLQAFEQTILEHC